MTKLLRFEDFVRGRLDKVYPIVKKTARRRRAVFEFHTMKFKHLFKKHTEHSVLFCTLRNERRIKRA
jgi:hypothetical protein